MAIVFDLQHYRSSSRSAPCRGRSREWLCRVALLIAYSFSFTDSFAHNRSATFLNILKVKPPYSRISIRSVYFLLGFCIKSVSFFGKTPFMASTSSSLLTSG